MKNNAALKHEFVEFIPEDLESGTIYISIRYKNATHLCCCGCGNVVVTPISATDWKLIFDGKTISLHPSIGNWNFPCQSHYWIRNNRVEWAPKWSRDKIERERSYDDAAKADCFAAMTESVDGAAGDHRSIKELRPKRRIWKRLKEWLS